MRSARKSLMPLLHDAEPEIQHLCEIALLAQDSTIFISAALDSLAMPIPTHGWKLFRCCVRRPISTRMSGYGG